MASAPDNTGLHGVIDVAPSTCLQVLLSAIHISTTEGHDAISFNFFKREVRHTVEGLSKPSIELLFTTLLKDCKRGTIVASFPGLP